MTARALWQLAARPEDLVRAGGAWREVARAARAVGVRTGRAAQTLLQGWEGEAALAYAEHERRTAGALAELSTVAERVADRLDDTAGVVRQTQHHLDDAWAVTRRRLAALTVAADLAPGVTFDRLSAIQREALVRAETEAIGIRARADAALVELVEALDAAGSRLTRQTVLIGDPAQRRTDWLALPDLGPAGAVILDGNRAIVNATGRDDAIVVGVDPVTAERLVTINSVTTRLPAGLDLVVRAGGGNDTITVSPGCRVRVTLLGGAGDDSISGSDGTETILGLWGDDTVIGGGGDDLVSGGAGRDYLDGGGGDDRLSGGLGDDTLYGLDGHDRLAGGEGSDYLDGGDGDDTASGGRDPDVVIGGRGDDLLLGGSEADAMYGGDGDDRVLAGDREDRAFVQPMDGVSGAAHTVLVELTEVGGNIRIEGSAEFVARVRSDLDALRASPAGAAMLAALEAEQADHPFAQLPAVGGLFQGDTLVIRATADRNGYASWLDLPIGPTPAVIEYNPTFDDLSRGSTPPVVVLYHELAHVYDAFYRTSAEGTYTGPDNYGVDNDEREAVGLPIDVDGDPSTPDELYPDHPYQLTENALREEMLLPLRRYY